ncbi:MAG: hypothetical protein V3T83_10665 [Acidobacteriota bacterium]
MVWPLKSLDGRRPLLAALDCARHTSADLLVAPGRAILASQLAKAGLKRRSLRVPRSFLFAKDGLGQRLAGLADLVAADGDSAE